MLENVNKDDDKAVEMLRFLSKYKHYYCIVNPVIGLTDYQQIYKPPIQTARMQDMQTVFIAVRYGKIQHSSLFIEHVLY